jgi:hypothetical protein
MSYLDKKHLIFYVVILIIIFIIFFIYLSYIENFATILPSKPIPYAHYNYYTIINDDTSNSQCNNNQTISGNLIINTYTGGSICFSYMFIISKKNLSSEYTIAHNILNLNTEVTNGMIYAQQYNINNIWLNNYNNNIKYITFSRDYTKVAFTDGHLIWYCDYKNTKGVQLISNIPEASLPTSPANLATFNFNGDFNNIKLSNDGKICYVTSRSDVNGTYGTSKWSTTIIPNSIIYYFKTDDLKLLSLSTTTSIPTLKIKSLSLSNDNSRLLFSADTLSYDKTKNSTTNTGWALYYIDITNSKNTLNLIISSSSTNINTYVKNNGSTILTAEISDDKSYIYTAIMVGTGSIFLESCSFISNNYDTTQSVYCNTAVIDLGSLQKNYYFINDGLPSVPVNGAFYKLVLNKNRSTLFLFFYSGTMPSGQNFSTQVGQKSNTLICYYNYSFIYNKSSTSTVLGTVKMAPYTYTSSNKYAKFTIFDPIVQNYLNNIFDINIIDNNLYFSDSFSIFSVKINN